MTVAEKLRLLAEFAETEEEFTICGTGYKFINGALNINDSYGIRPSRIDIIDIKSASIARLPFKPKKGEKYYFVAVNKHRGYDCYENGCVSIDKLLLSRETVYRTEEEVKEEVRKRGWTVEN